MFRRIRSDDSGQGMLPLMVLVAFSILIITFSLLIPWGAATTEKAQSQTAADAAALAALQEKRDVWMAGVEPKVLSMLSTTPLKLAAQAAGCGSALSYAARNDATATCDPTPYGGGGVAVEATNLRTSDDDTGRASSRARARMDIDFSACDWTLVTLPAPPPTGPPLFTNTLKCDEWDATYVLENVPGVYPTVALKPGSDRRTLYNDLEPRLVE